MEAAPSGSCLQPELVETLAADVLHQPGQPWPPVLWRPVHAAVLRGSLVQPVLAGAGVAAVEAPGGVVWAEDVVASLGPARFIRSEAAWVPCPPA
jgi:hypothetical protein